MRRRLFTATIATALAVTTAGCGSNDEPTDATKDTDQVEVMSWWTSGSEARAFSALLSSYRSANPQVTATNAAVSGGAGSAAIVALAKRLQEDNPPDVWQGFAGKALQGYADRGEIRSVASVVNPLRAQMNPTIYSSLLKGGQPYGVPSGSHRGNVLFFNTAVLSKAGVTAPTAATTPAQLLAMMQKVTASGATALCLGGKDRFTRVELFENVLLATIGAAGMRKVAADTFDWRGPQAKAALKTFGDMLKLADPQADSQSWDAAIRKLGSGGCGFVSMNDSGYAELTSTGATPGQDFEAIAFPGTGGSYTAVVDVFVAGTKAKNAKNALAFLGRLSDPATQTAFSTAKGSIPVLKNVPVTSLPAYQQQASKAFWSAPVLLSLTHGEAVNSQSQFALYTAVHAYARNGNAGAFATELEQAADPRGGAPAR